MNGRLGLAEQAREVVQRRGEKKGVAFPIFSCNIVVNVALTIWITKCSNFIHNFFGIFMGTLPDVSVRFEQF